MSYTSSNSVKFKNRVRCKGKRKCELKADTDVYGDPCPNQDKYLFVKYECKGKGCKDYII